MSLFPQESFCIIIAASIQGTNPELNDKPDGTGPPTHSCSVEYHERTSELRHRGGILSIQLLQRPIVFGVQLLPLFLVCFQRIDGRWTRCRPCSRICAIAPGSPTSRVLWRWGYRPTPHRLLLLPALRLKLLGTKLLLLLIPPILRGQGGTSLFVHGSIHHGVRAGRTNVVHVHAGGPCI